MNTCFQWQGDKVGGRSDSAESLKGMKSPAEGLAELLVCKGEHFSRLSDIFGKDDNEATLA